MNKWILLFALITVAAARPDIGYGGSSASEEDSRSYEFSWNVKDSDEDIDMGHNEKKSEGKVEGYYYILLPDTRRQKVTYYVDGDSGYIADVTYSGEAEFDSHQEQSREQYGK